MIVVDERHGRVVSGRLGKLTPEKQLSVEKASHRAPGARRQWIAPTWERLETPMEITMYAGRR
jgi:hypothetical protein